MIILWATAGGACTVPPVDTDNSVLTNPSVALNVPTDGYAIGVCVFSGSATTTWTGLTETTDAVADSNTNYTGASADFAAAETGRTMTCDSGAATEPVGVFASWGPGEDPGGPADPGGTQGGIVGGGVF